jgi:transforming growth factor-beta-induced protein
LDGFTNNGLKAVLDGHIYSDSKIYADQLKSFNGTSITLSDNSSVPVSVTNKVTLAGKIDVVEPDVLVSGGVVHIIDQVLVPENIRLCKEN